MPSPFPGMDPYIEHPQRFPGFHGPFVVYLQAAIQPMLPPEYYARLGRRVWIEFAERYVEPDVYVLAAKRYGVQPEQSSGGVAVLDPTVAKPVVVPVPAVPDDEYRENYIEIYEAHGEKKRLVTVIELLSPTNKKPGKRGRDLYLQKQHELLERRVHLVEIDLLRGGTHTTAVPQEGARKLAGPFDYHICVHQYNLPRELLVYPIKLTEPLPSIPIPLLPDKPPVVANLQAVFDRSYSTGGFDREIDYMRDEIVPPLTPEQEAWAKKLIAQRQEAASRSQKATG